MNLDTLKQEVLEYLDSAGFAVFHGHPGGLEGPPVILWDTEHHPDYRMFLEVARKAGVNLVVFATREFEAADLDDLLAQIEDCELTREERRDYESRLRELRIFEGVTCSLDLAFDLHSRLYVYEVQPDWYEEFLGVEDEIASRMADEEDLDEGESLGGYFSKN
ncbi:MAG: hypothetical protein ABSG79_21690 [Bryobacteraceae bacterium]